MDTLTFAELREANVARATNRYGYGDIDEWNEAEWGNALAGEVGELCNLLKKMIRQAPGDPSLKELYREAGKEIGDIQTYLDLLAEKLGHDLGEVTRNKFNEVSDRIGVDVKLSAPGGASSGVQRDLD